MRIALSPIGTRGDVQPMLALGLALRDRGHDVRLCGPPNSLDWVIDAGLPFFPVGHDIAEMLEGQWRDLVENPLAPMRKTGEIIGYQFDDLLKACEGAQVLVGGGMQWAGPSVAAVLDIPYVYAAYSPIVLKSSERPSPIVVEQDHPAWLNRLSWWAAERLFNLIARKHLNRQRRILGLAEIRSTYRYAFGSGTTLLATDPVLAPPPVRCEQQVTTTGFWFLDEPDPVPLPADLEAFIRDGAPPIFVGFGSMPSTNPERVTRQIVEAVLASGRRAVLQRGWAGLGDGDLPETIRTVGPVSHAKLFPKMAAIVHHGGAGTTANALRAGVPQVVVPHIVDQFYWADAVHKLGLGPRAPLMRRMDTRRLANAIRVAAASAGLRDRAREVALLLDTQSGIERAVAAIEGVEGIED